MQQVQLYIEGQRVELFQDEIISLTQSIQNIKDPATIFTGFTQQFSLPATRQTNKLFQHYYNFDIVGGYDARIKTNAIIELNSKPFQMGKIRLQGIDMKDNVPYSYKVIFYGDLVEVKDKIGEDELSDLAWLDNFQKVFSMTDIKASLQDSTGSMTHNSITYTNVMRTSLIDSVRRLYYDSTFHTEDDGNLYYHSTGHSHGALWSNLKYSIGIHMIVKAIEDKYNITFSNDFFNDDNSKYKDLFMFMHRKKGAAQAETNLPSNFVLLPTSLSSGGSRIAYMYGSVTGCLITDKYYQTFQGEITSLSNGFRVNAILGNLGAGNGFDISWGFNFQAQPHPSDQSKIYTVEIYYTPDFGTEQLTPSYSVTSTGTGQNIVSFSYAATSFHTHWNDTGNFRVQITSNEPITFNTGQITINGEFYWTDSTYYQRVGTMGFCVDTRSACSVSCSGFATNTNTSVEEVLDQFAWIPTQQLPKMKVIDFLTGLFRLWNLTAYYDGDIVKVEPLDEFYGVSTRSYSLNSFSTPTGWSYNSISGLVGSNASTTAIDNNFFTNPDVYSIKIEISSYSSGTIKLKTDTDESSWLSGNGVYNIELDATTNKLEIEGSNFTGAIGAFGKVKIVSDASTIYDISEYVDVKTSSVLVGLPYKQIDMRFKGNGSILAKKFEQIHNRRFGDLEYTGDLSQTNKWAGGVYKLEVPFEKMIFERLFNGDTISQTNLQVGNMIDDNSSAYIGEPLLHYMVHITGVGFSFLEDKYTPVSLSNYNAPFNCNGNQYNSDSINFYAEFNEWTANTITTANDNNLFELYYENYMKDVFNKQRRITKIKSWLPLKILLKYNLGDRFRINQNLYRINSITTNLQSGESDMELLNEV